MHLKWNIRDARRDARIGGTPSAKEMLTRVGTAATAGTPESVETLLVKRRLTRVGTPATAGAPETAETPAPEWTH